MKLFSLILGTSLRKPVLALVFTFYSLFSLSQNPVVMENANPGNPFSEWGVPDFRDISICGFATDISVNKGNIVRFKITVAAGATYTIKIYRLGYYGGNGARLMANLGSFTGTVQPAGIENTTTGSLDCGNWAESAQWAVPATAVSGVYIAKLERTGGGSNHILFVVRDDASNSDIYFQTPDATWQAYNGYGGNSVYNGTTAFPNGHAVKMSYNRPFFVYNSGFQTDGRESDWYMNAVYPMIRWIERNGYNTTYTTSVDMARSGSLLLNHKIFVSVGHDEYWSKEQRDNVEAARDAGVNLAFFSGNEVYWKTRWESDVNGGPFRTLVCYKEGNLGTGLAGESSCGAKCDASSSVWTGLWRTGGNYDAGRPENALTGQMSWEEVAGAITVPATYKKLRFWRNTSIVSLANGQSATLAPNTLGHEWDWEQYEESYPSGRITMSSTTINNHTHKLSLYRHQSGALVFGAGTVQWSWGLDDQHYGGTPVISQDMQQATVNLFADMGVQPGTLQSGMLSAVQSTDNTAPFSTTTFPVNGQTIASGSVVTITGTATDANGVAAGVEVSVDGGVTWKPATSSSADGTITWSYTWTTTNQGTVNIKCRGVDDSGNIETAGSGISVTIGAPVCPCTIFLPSEQPAPAYVNISDPNGSVELGVKFKTNTSGYIKGIRFYKSSLDTGPHVATLWNLSGTILAQATFMNETTSGWQEVNFSTPVSVASGTTYLASYHSTTGYYAGSPQFFTTALSRGPLSAIANADTDGPNGLYSYGPATVFPTLTFNATNYWVDVVFITSFTTLPVRLTEFSAVEKNNDVELNWVTASEQNNRGFEIHRSDNGSSAWTTIGFVNGSGNSNIIRQYQYLDKDLAPGAYHYRLKQIDFDNNSRFSPVVMASINGSAVLYQNYPNPFTGSTIIKFYLPEIQRIKLSVFDVSGREIKVLTEGLKSAGTHTAIFNTGGISNVLYYYRLETEKGSEVKKLLVK